MMTYAFMIKIPKTTLVNESELRSITLYNKILSLFFSVETVNPLLTSTNTLIKKRKEI